MRKIVGPRRGLGLCKYILAVKPNAKIAVLYQHDDYGRDYLEGLREGLGHRADAMVVATASYETSDPTMDSQITAQRASGADTIRYVATPKFAAMAIRKVADLGWKPLQIVNFPAATATAMKAAGASAATGAIVAFSIGVDPSDPRRSRMILHGVTLPDLVPGTSISYTPTDYDAYKQFRLYRFDSTRFVPYGRIVSKKMTRAQRLQ
jgi:hypothetical protein